MAIGLSFFIIAVVVILIWIFVEIRRVRHKLWAFFLIGLILFTYISFSASLKSQDVELNSVGGVIDAGKLYISWLGGVFLNLKSITSYATEKDWNEYDDSVINVTTDFENIWERLN